METISPVKITLDSDDGGVTFRSSCYPQNFVNQLAAFRSDNFMMDINLKVQEKLFPCHKLVLTANSAYFKTMFTKNFAESRENTIELKDVSPEAVEILISFLYSGCFKLSENVVSDVLFVASMWQLDDVIEPCHLFLKNKLSPDNVYTFLHLAKLYNFTDVIHLSKKIICKHFSEVVSNTEYFKLSFEDVMGIIKDPNLRSSKEDVSNAVVSWIKSNQEIKEMAMISLLSAIPLSCLSLECLQQTSSCEIWQTLPSCAEYLSYLINGAQLLDTQNSFENGLDNEIYILGGDQNPKYLIKFNMETGKFKKLAEIPHRHSCYGSAFINNNIFAIDADQSLAVSKYDTRANIWHSCRPLPRKIFYPSVGVVNDKIYVCGGNVDNSTVNSVLQYNPSTNQWSNVAAMRESRIHASAIAHNGFLYIVGGYNQDNNSALKSSERYNVLFDRWDTITLPHPKYASAVVAVNNCFYIIGGRTVTRRISSVLKYDIALGTWSDCNPMPYCASSLSICLVGNKIYVTGGISTDDTSLDSSVIFDVDLNSWTEGPKLPCPFKLHSSFSVLR